MTDHNSELLSRGLQARMDDREDCNPVVEACLGYAGAVGVMAMDAMASDGERTDKAMQGIVESVRRVDARQDEWTELMGTQSGRVDALAAELVDAREVMAEMRRELEAERRAQESLQELLAVRKLEHRSYFSPSSHYRRSLFLSPTTFPLNALPNRLHSPPFPCVHRGQFFNVGPLTDHGLITDLTILLPLRT